MKNETIAEKDWHPRPVREQIDLLAEEFNLQKEQTLRFLDETFPNAVLPSEARGWFALPTIEAVANRFFPDAKNTIEKYRRSTELALDKISKRSQEFEGLDCKSTPEKFFLLEKTRLALEEIRIQQSGDIIVLPVRFNVKTVLTSKDEFILGSFFTACLGLGHFERYSAVALEPVPTKTIECIGFGPVKCRKCWFEDARIKWNQATGYIPKFTTTLA